MRKLLTVAMALAISPLVSNTAFAVAIDLGQASKYSAFIKNDFKATSSDTEGRIAVGGNFTVDGGYDVGAEVTYLNMGDGPSLVVGGVVKTGSGFLNVYLDKKQSGEAVIGDLAYSDKVTNDGVVVTDSNVHSKVAANLIKHDRANLPVEFDSAFAHLETLSSDLISATANGQIKRDNGWGGKEVTWGPLNFTPTSTPSDNVYVFNVTQEQLNEVNEWDVSGVSDDATIIFNLSNPNAVRGGNQYNETPNDCAEGQKDCIYLGQTNITINGVLLSDHFAGKGYGPTNKGAYKNSTMTNNVLFNFGNATQVTLASDLYGSVLAPKADIKANPSVIWGQVIGKSWEGNMQVNYNPFSPTGTKPPGPTPVPTPATLWVFSLALALLYVNRKSFIKVKRKA